MQQLMFSDQELEELVREHFRHEARDFTNNIMTALEWIRNAVKELQYDYCNLKRLDSADAIDINEFLSRENIELIESLLKIFGLKCEIAW